MSILQHYKYPTFRLGHKELLEYVESVWEKYDIFLIVAPPGCGKTVLKQTLARWAGHASMIAPTNQLILQEREEYPDTAAFFGKDSPYYLQEKYDYYEDCRLTRAAMEEGRPTLSTLYGLISHKLQRPVLIVDEGHKLLEFNVELNAKKIWRSKAQFPININSRKELESWLSSSECTALTPKAKKQWLSKLETNDYMVERKKDYLKGKLEDSIQLTPLTPPLHGVLRKGLSKLILMSATINEIDVKELKIGRGNRVCTIELPSVIPEANRPIVRQYIGKVNFYNLEKSAAAIARKLKDLADFHQGSLGFAHVTYALIPLLQKYLGSDPRFMFHNKFNSKDRLAEWQSYEKDKVFVGAGFTEGLDLKGEKFQWQAICKIAWPGLGDPAIKKKADLDPKWYIWKTVQQTAQAIGRICRSETDEGVTYILDESFERLYSEARRLELWPNYITTLE